MEHARQVRTAGVDGVRALAALVVFGFHTQIFSGWAPSLSLGRWSTPLVSFSQAGYLGVDIFFVVSGFCLYLPYARALKAGERAPATTDFYFARALKILPSYYIVLAITAALSVPLFAPADFWRLLFAHVVFLHNTGPQFGYWNSVLWSLGVEVQFYAVFPLIAALARRWPTVTFAALFLIAYAYRQMAFGCCATTESVTRVLPAYLDLFAWGMIAATVIAALEQASDVTLAAVRQWRALPAVVVALLLFALFQFVASLTFMGGGRELWNGQMRIVSGLETSVLLLAACLTPLERLFASRSGWFISVLSYNIYLWHTLLELVLMRTGAMARIQAAWSPLLSGGMTFWIAGASVTLAVSFLVTYFIERPILSLRRRHGFAFDWRRRAPRIAEPAQSYAGPTT